MGADETGRVFASNQPIRGEESQITRGISHVNEQVNDVAEQVFVTATEVGALSKLLVERGLIAKEDLKEQRAIVAKRLEAVFREKQIGVKVDARFPDKYAIPADALPQIDCEQRLPLCRAACCAMRFALSTQDVEEGVMRWELGQPYVNRVGPDHRCVHQDRVTCGCTIYQHRPGVCRMYDCRKDARIWQDFENRVINPKLFVKQSDGTLTPRFEQPLLEPEAQPDPPVDDQVEW